MAGVCFLPPVVDFLAEAFWGVSFLAEVPLLGVYLRTLSTVFLTSAPSEDFLPPFYALPADFEAAFLAPLTVLTLGAAPVSATLAAASLPFSWTKISLSERTAVLPSLKEKSEKSSPLEAETFTIPPSTLALEAVETLAISGRESPLMFLERAAWMAA